MLKLLLNRCEINIEPQSMKTRENRADKELIYQKANSQSNRSFKFKTPSKK